MVESFFHSMWYRDEPSIAHVKCTLMGLLLHMSSCRPCLSGRGVIAAGCSHCLYTDRGEPDDNKDDYIKLDVTSEWVSHSLGMRRLDCKALAGTDNIVSQIRSRIRQQRSGRSLVSRIAYRFGAPAFDPTACFTFSFEVLLSCAVSL